MLIHASVEIAIVTKRMGCFVLPLRTNVQKWLLAVTATVSLSMTMIVRVVRLVVATLLACFAMHCQTRVK
jgi:hypothetical protein